MTATGLQAAQRRSGRVVLLDPAGEPEAVAGALAAHREVTVEAGTDLPEGDDVLALLVAPEVAVGAPELARIPGVALVAATATGFDHLDLSAIAAAGAWATHCPGYCDLEVAEHAIALALNLLRGIARFDACVRTGDWHRVDVAPRQVGGAVLGIVGLGRIGREAARLGQGLGMRVLASDPQVIETGEPPLVGLDELLAASDVVTLHAALTPQTRHLIGTRELARMPPGAFLVNCSRAALVDHQALGDALRSGRLGGCALDVLPGEPPEPDEPALGWPRTLLSPHVAYLSPRTAQAPYRLGGEAVAAVLEGRQPHGALTRPAR